MNAREVIRVLESQGAEQLRQNGSHRVFAMEDGSRVVVPDHGGRDVAPGTLDSIWRQAGLDHLRGVSSVREAMRRIDDHARGPAPAALDAADQILSRNDNVGIFMGREGNVSVVLNESERALVITENGRQTVTQFDTVEEAQHAFGERIDAEATRRGELPTRYTGTYDDIADGFRRSTGIIARVGGSLADVGRFLGKTARVLGPLGVVGATAEAAELGSKAHEMAEYGVIPDEAILAYDTMLAAHVAQATVDPSMVGGEAAIQLAFEEWADAYDIPDYMREELEPSSLMEMVFGEIAMRDAAPEQGALSETFTTASPFMLEPEPLTEADMQELRDYLEETGALGKDEFYDSLPDEVPEGAAIDPELEAMITQRALIEAIDEQLESPDLSPENEAALQEMRAEAQGVFDENYYAAHEEGTLDQMREAVSPQAETETGIQPETPASTGQTYTQGMRL